MDGRDLVDNISANVFKYAPALNCGLNVVDVLGVKPYARPITFCLQPPAQRLLARQAQEVRVPHHEQFYPLRGFGRDPYLKQAPKLVDRADFGSVYLANIKIGSVSRRVFFPDPNHFTIVHSFVK
jgi:hypothetical protein